MRVWEYGSAVEVLLEISQGGDLQTDRKLKDTHPMLPQTKQNQTSKIGPAGSLNLFLQKSLCKWQSDSSDLLKCRFPLLDEGPNLLSPDSKDERETILSASHGSCNCVAQVQLSV